MGTVQWLALVSTPIVLLALYIFWNDRRLTTIPGRALSLSATRLTPADARVLAERLSGAPLTDQDALPVKTGRRYIIVGGGGFLGAWIATKLLDRGENPRKIRLLDLNPPLNHAVTDALPKGVQFIKVDITDAGAVEAAFQAPWPMSGCAEPITVFHTAANIRFYERHQEFVARSTKVNVLGTQNVIKAAQAVGVDVLVYTSSGSVGLHTTRLLGFPWEKEPKNIVQVVNEDALHPKRHEDFFSNYAASKAQGEAVVRASDKLPTSTSKPNKVLRTGCLRPGNGIYGPRGDMNLGAWMIRRHNPSMCQHVVQSFMYVENCASAHLCYEARLIELQSGTSKYPDIGGQAFYICDPGPPPTYGDLFTILTTLTDGDTKFLYVSPTFMLLLAHVLEWYYRFHQSLLRRGLWAAKLIPPLGGDLINLQPSLFPLILVHLVIDDSRARLPPEKGGLGYKGVWTSEEGAYRTVEEHKAGVGIENRRSENAGLKMNFGLTGGAKKAGDIDMKAKVGVDVPESLKLTNTIPVVAPMEVSHIK